MKLVFSSKFNRRGCTRFFRFPIGHVIAGFLSPASAGIYLSATSAGRIRKKFSLAKHLEFVIPAKPVPESSSRGDSPAVIPAKAGIQSLFSTFGKSFPLPFDCDTASEAGIQGLFPLLGWIFGLHQVTTQPLKPESGMTKL